LPRRPEDDHHGHDRGRSRRPARPERQSWQRDAFDPDDTDADLPQWAAPSEFPAKLGGARRRVAASAQYAGDGSTRVDDGDRGGLSNDVAEKVGARTAALRRGRAAATRLRKSRRRVYRWSAVGVVVCVIGAVIAVIATQSSPKPSPYVTTLQTGEFKSVPNACQSVSASVLAQYLPGSGRTTTNQFSGSTQSQCSFTIDARPVFRLLEVSAQAYQPFAAASGDGSASENAKDNLTLARVALAQPPKGSPLSAAQIAALPKLGQQAFSAYQQEKAGTIVSDVVTVVVRERNVLITVQLSAQESQGFASTPVATLQAGAAAAAQDMLAKAKEQPTA
jgi:hypothetical protein